MLTKGSVVISLAGRDKGYLLTVLSSTQKAVTIADGKERPLNKPKRKNIRHIKETSFTLCEDEMMSDRAIRKALRRISTELSGNNQEDLCLNRT